MIHILNVTKCILFIEKDWHPFNKSCIFTLILQTVHAWNVSISVIFFLFFTKIDALHETVHASMFFLWTIHALYAAICGRMVLWTIYTYLFCLYSPKKGPFYLVFSLLLLQKCFNNPKHFFLNSFVQSRCFDSCFKPYTGQNWKCTYFVNGNIMQVYLK